MVSVLYPVEVLRVQLLLILRKIEGLKSITCREDDVDDDEKDCTFGASGPRVLGMQLNH